MEVTEAPSGHRATELICQFYLQLIYKAFITKYLSRICTLHLRRSLCRRHLRDIAFTSVSSVTPCAYYISVLVYQSIFQKNFYSYITIVLTPFSSSWNLLNSSLNSLIFRYKGSVKYLKYSLIYTCHINNNMYFCTKFNKRIRDSLLNKQIFKGYL